MFSPSANAAVTVYFNGQNHAAARQNWQNAAAPYTTIPFTGFAPNTIITNQYQQQGILFTDGTDRITFNESFLNDQWGLRGVLDDIHVAFQAPVSSIATDFIGDLRIRLYDDGLLVYTSPDFFSLGGHGFAGLISTTPFDAAIISDPTGNVNIDDLFFGPPIPAPPVLTLLAFAAKGARRRRRSTPA
jgi:hypothetical protein